MTIDSRFPELVDNLLEKVDIFPEIYLVQIIELRRIFCIFVLEKMLDI